MHNEIGDIPGNQSVEVQPKQANRRAQTGTGYVRMALRVCGYRFSGMSIYTAEFGEILVTAAPVRVKLLITVR
jgi:hypothetical protein